MKHRTRRRAVPLLILLIALAAVERRVADLDLNALTGSVMTNDESILGEELRVKLMAVHDFVAPRPVERSGLVVAAPAQPVPSTVIRAFFDPKSPRAPPQS